MTMMNHFKSIGVDFKNETLRKLVKLKNGEVMGLDPEEKDYQKRVEACKIIMHWEQDKDNGFEIVFNANYTAVKKRVIN